MSDLIGAINAVGNLILRFIIVILAFLVRKELKKRDLSILRFYDLLVISFIVYAISKIFFLPLNLDRAGLLDINEKTARTLNSIANFLINIFGILLVYAWIKLFKGLTQRYRLIPIVQPFPGELAKTLPPGVYITKHSGELCDECKTLLQGRKAIIITRRKPEDLKSKLGAEIPILWLAKVEAPGVVYPHNLERLAHELISFMKSEKGPKSIMIDGFEYLMIENGFEPVFKFLTSLKDYAILTDTVIIVPIKKEALEGRKYALLLREFRKLEELEAAQIE
ncbi:DUF835 domain-containing protein [Thermococcus argininiproducens]|uniref:DUF835 domain-containing protein n=1 Tax=Thermococcus argininiproducens TaxID=2866384 RepID=A0A9E7MBF3_9EURY|nr:DUF835 domain-containing protein [Thermococcus argininiproducens]USH00796.1 DUF835 domain-containing protein [Thermococcus argininiproducens]